ncbi:hypothetical protein [Aquabacterium sp. OR-4]|uniref:hypothetical protein n=1 Tax=Aquabacterium sp. OR-4 TaxID=2978127 RepID=UPI0021B3CAF4|nr:hypothetical protein [Aquabacterium sp. OR-4]MDT7836908.1 hypothetical protein [Aquabacterium sp. OR-4]MDT7839095.1 hypothetical protein [Aquabacterium sp. OR-4]
MPESFFYLLLLATIGVLWLVLRSFFPSYIGEKGKNLATKEDIAAITQKVEEVKEAYAKRLKELEHQNALVLEQLRSQQQLRLAAVERRLAAHQEAFTLWRRLVAAAHSDDVHALVLECQDWWEKNCLYLGPEARDSFNRAYFTASSHRELIRSRTSAEEVKVSWSLLLAAGDALLSGVQLPSLGEREAKSAA